MQSPFVAQLAEIRHNDLHAEAARRRIIDRACADRPTAIAAVASARGRVRMALANAAVGLREQGASMSARVNTSPAISGLGADPL